MYTTTVVSDTPPPIGTNYKGSSARGVTSQTRPSFMVDIDGFNLGQILNSM